jgi:NOL1/NOP2/fmu family ribosome biogenesis protein
MFSRAEYYHYLGLTMNEKEQSHCIEVKSESGCLANLGEEIKESVSYMTKYKIVKYLNHY